MSRDALVVGISQYAHLQNLRSPAVDAEAIAEILTRQGDFRVLRLSEVIDAEGDLTIGVNSHRYLRRLL